MEEMACWIASQVLFHMQYRLFLAKAQENLSTTTNNELNVLADMATLQTPASSSPPQPSAFQKRRKITLDDPEKSKSQSFCQEKRYCKRSRLVTNLTNIPFRSLSYHVEKQYTLSRKEAEHLAVEERTKKVEVKVRILGDVSCLLFVAKDVCCLIHVRKGNVSKAIGQFNATEKAKMPVRCLRPDGVLAVHNLNVLTLQGVKRLFRDSRSERVSIVQPWFMEQVHHLVSDLSSKE